MITEWRWYDFYAAQGDEPYYICSLCWELPKHQTRMSNDRYNRQQEEKLVANNLKLIDRSPMMGSMPEVILSAEAVKGIDWSSLEQGDSYDY
jgi:hypothetical protein